jgi:hypothetical protein
MGDHQWVRLLGHPTIDVDLETGMVAVFGEVVARKPEFLEIGRVSATVLQALEATGEPSDGAPVRSAGPRTARKPK